MIWGISYILQAQSYYYPKLTVVSSERGLISWNTEAGLTLGRFIDNEGNMAEDNFPLFGHDQSCFNLEQSYLVSKRIEYPESEYWPASFTEFAKIYSSNGDTTQSFIIRGGDYPMCGMDFLGFEISVKGLDKNFLSVLQNDGYFSLTRYDQQGVKKFDYNTFNNAYKLDCAGLSDSSYLAVWSKGRIEFENDSIPFGIYAVSVYENQQIVQDSITIKQYPQLSEHSFYLRGAFPCFRIISISDTSYMLAVFKPDSAHLNVFHLNASAGIISSQSIPLPLDPYDESSDQPVMETMNISNIAANTRTIFLSTRSYWNQLQEGYNFLLYFNSDGNYTGLMEIDSSGRFSDSDFKFKTDQSSYINTDISQKDIYAYFYQKFNKMDSVKIGTITALEHEVANPLRTLHLAQNYPNPFNPTTIISYQTSAINNVNLAVYNALGQKIRTLVNIRQKAGSYSVIFDATGLSSGIYYYRLSCGEFDQVRKMLILR